MSDADLTRLLNQARAGDEEAGARAYAVLYEQLRRIARGQMSLPGSTLSATALVHEAYLKLLPGSDAVAPLVDRAHFLRLAARAMRQIVVDHARERGARKRGGDWQVVDISAAAALAVTTDPVGVLAIEQAVQRLEQRDPTLARIVEGYFYAGLTFDELASVLDSSERSVRRGWELARAFLVAELGGA